MKTFCGLLKKIKKMENLLLSIYFICENKIVNKVSYYFILKANDKIIVANFYLGNNSSTYLIMYYHVKKMFQSEVMCQTNQLTEENNKLLKELQRVREMVIFNNNLNILYIKIKYIFRMKIYCQRLMV